jgi:predicted GNAT superfamily acetyltransferase
MESECIKILSEISEFHELLSIQKDVWGVDDIDVVPVHTFKAVSAFLGPKALILGYFVDEKISGYLLAFPTSDPKEVFGAMIGVARNCQRKGIGYKLNLEFRKRMLAQGVDKISWTFDPLESVNGNLYIAKLGGIITHHLMDYYGTVNSRMHSGLPTDRFKVEWNIREKRVQERIETGHGENHYRVASGAEGVELVEIPFDIQELKTRDLDQALEWRMKTRALFDEYLEKQGLVGVDFLYDRDGRKGAYVFAERPAD